MTYTELMRFGWKDSPARQQEMPADEPETFLSWKERNEREIAARMGKPFQYPEPPSASYWLCRAIFPGSPNPTEPEVRRPIDVPEAFRDHPPDDWPKLIKAQKAQPVPVQPKTQRDNVWDKTGGFCYLCDCALTDATFTMDHVVPLSRGGRKGTCNLMPACFQCNQKKGNSMPTPEMLDRMMACM